MACRASSSGRAPRVWRGCGGASSRWAAGWSWHRPLARAAGSWRWRPCPCGRARRRSVWMADDIAVLLVDDQDLFREGVRVIVDAQPGMRVVGSAADGYEAVRL